MDALYGLLRSLPGQMVDLVQSHPLISIVLGVVALGAGYLLLLKLALALQDLDDVRKRK